MAILDDEIMHDVEQDAQIVAYIANQLPEELRATYDEETLYYIHDLYEECLSETDILESEPDEEGYVDIVPEAVVDYILKVSRKEKMGPFDAEALLLIVNAELDFLDDID